MALPAAAKSGCTVSSGPNTAALIELYTSEGCSSCPPADQQLIRLKRDLDPGATVVPLSLHVDYWDYIGWKDPYARAVFGARQSWLVHANRQRVVYTPQFFVGGAELRSWRGALRERVRQVNAQPAAASIRLDARIAPDGRLTLAAEVKVEADPAPGELFLAVTESKLASNVTRGENSGASLNHDHVVREWIGPLPVTAGAARARHVLALPANWNRDRLGVVAFVQNQRSGKVLQAISARPCAGS